MGWLVDLFKEIPLSVIQQEKIAQAEAKQTAVEAEKASLKDDLREAQAQIAQLKKELEKFTHKPLADLDIQILQMITAFRSAPIALIAQQLDTQIEAVELQVNTLVKNDYIEWKLDDYGEYNYHLRDKARRYLIDNNLLPPPSY